MPFRAATQTSNAGGVPNTDPGIPAGTVAGDALIAFFSADASGMGNVLPTGYTLGHVDDITNGDTQTVGWGWRKATGTDASAFTNTGSNSFGCAILAYKNIDTSGATPFDGTPTFNNPNSVTVPSSPVTTTGTGFTTTIPGEDIILLASVDTNGNDGVWAPGGSLITRAVTVSTGQFSALGVFDFSQVTAGATGNQTAVWTLTGAVGNFVAYLIALKGFPPAAQPFPGNPKRRGRSGGLAMGLNLAEWF